MVFPITYLKDSCNVRKKDEDVFQFIFPYQKLAFSIKYIVTKDWWKPNDIKSDFHKKTLQ